MERWRQVFRDGIVPHLSEVHLEALRGGLVKDDWRLRQGQTLWVVGGLHIMQACAVGYAAWQGARLERVADVERFFRRLRAAVDAALNDPAAFDDFTDWFDSTQRHVAWPLLLAEVNRALAARAAGDLEEVSPEATATETVPREAAEALALIGCWPSPPGRRQLPL